MSMKETSSFIRHRRPRLDFLGLRRSNHKSSPQLSEMLRCSCAASSRDELSVAWYIVVEREIPGFDHFVSGKAVAKAGNRLDPSGSARRHCLSDRIFIEFGLPLCWAPSQFARSKVENEERLEAAVAMVGQKSQTRIPRVSRSDDCVLWSHCRAGHESCRGSLQRRTRRCQSASKVVL